MIVTNAARGRGRPKGTGKNQIARRNAEEINRQLYEETHPAGPDLRALLETLEAAVQRKLFNKLTFFKPYPKQCEFFDAGLTAKERLLIAGNQLGKTEAGAFEMACHLTGLYPEWWLGHRFDHPVKAWAACESGLLVRDGAQAKLCGEPGVTEAFGTGFIPKKLIVGQPTLGRGVTNGFDTVQVRHTSGGISTLGFKSYEQGRQKFQSATLDLMWCDEEPPLDIYMECLARLTATQGILMMTFTPLLGGTAVVHRFLEEEADDRATVGMDIKDALHISPERAQEIEASYPSYMRDARVHGIPMLGSGRIFRIAEENIKEPAIERIPTTWAKLWGLDFGILHPFAAVLIAYDRDDDVVHVLHTIRIKDATPLQHADAIRSVGINVPVAWPHDGTQRDKGSGSSLASMYRKHGLKMLPTHATWPTGGVDTETGIQEMTERMETGRLLIADHLTQFFEEFRSYHRKDGLIVKERDDILSATRIAIMAKRFARAVPLGSEEARSRIPETAEDFDLFAV